MDEFQLRKTKEQYEIDQQYLSNFTHQIRKYL